MRYKKIALIETNNPDWKDLATTWLDQPLARDDEDPSLRQYCRSVLPVPKWVSHQFQSSVIRARFLHCLTQAACGHASLLSHPQL